MNPSIKTVQGTTRLMFESVDLISNTVEDMHETIARRAFVWSPPPQEKTYAHGAIATAVYDVIRRVNRSLQKGVNHSFDLLNPGNSDTPDQSKDIRFRATLNGVLGDHLEDSKNPLAIPMTLLNNGDAVELERCALGESIPSASPHLVVLVHGLCHSELNWSRKERPSLDAKLTKNLDCTSLHLRYNTGRHISTNGRELAAMLETLCAEWPVPVESLSLIGHSMGGLVIRSACWYAQQKDNAWLEHLKRVLCLGTPHHGSHVAKAGHALDILLKKSPYVAPLALAQKRSVGLKDLRHGNLLDEDWQDECCDVARQDNRRPVPLLAEVEYYFIAATIGRDHHDVLGHILGDLLVRLDSATGVHKEDLHRLHIKPDNCRVYTEKSHLDLLDDPRVHEQVIEWFQAA
ncbi:MAG: pimeloyl-ACP methyl ester carboxylesterase [Glaciecola sp.]|jgi:pimeloyl-ACP methyl ester carboxylesterase|uniref:esterase/lipase family protein n=1 Tax=Congregibacter sp. TaxID=2744308 RepID=UPI0039E30A98